MRTLRSEVEACLRRINSDIYLKYHQLLKSLNSHLSMLGVLQRFQRKFASYPADIEAGCYHLFCYSDIAALQLVGDSYSPLLRTVKIDCNYGDIITLFYETRLHSCCLPTPLKYHNEIKTDQSEPVNFTYGKTIVKLHFRGKTIRRTGHKRKQDIFLNKQRTRMSLLHECPSECSWICLQHR